MHNHSYPPRYGRSCLLKQTAAHLRWSSPPGRKSVRSLPFGQQPHHPDELLRFLLQALSLLFPLKPALHSFPVLIRSRNRVRESFQVPSRPLVPVRFHLPARSQFRKPLLFPFPVRFRLPGRLLWLFRLRNPSLPLPRPLFPVSLPVLPRFYQLMPEVLRYTSG